LAGATRAVDGLGAVEGRGRPDVELAGSRRFVSAVDVGDEPTAQRMFTMLPLRLATNSTDSRLLRPARSFFVRIHRNMSAKTHTYRQMNTKNK